MEQHWRNGTGGLKPMTAGAALLIFLLLIVSGGGGCNRGGQSAEGGEVSGDAAADTTGIVAADSAAQAGIPDSTAAEEKGNFLSKLFRGGDDEEDQEEDELVPVELSRVAVTDLPAYLATTATLEPEKQAEVLAKIDGGIREILAEEGDWVLEGQVLAVLDGAAQTVSLEEAQARRQGFERDLERARGLFEQDLASEKELNDAQSQFEQAGAQYRAAQLQVDYTRILAPFTGRLAERHVDRGQTVGPGTPIFHLVDPDPLLARIHLPEREALKIERGQAVVISPDTDLSQRVSGEVLRVAPVVDSRTGTVKVTCMVSGATGGIRPGSFVRVRVRTDLRHDVLAIPKRALVTEGRDIYVFRAEADSVVKVPIVTGLTNHTLIQVIEGLAAGERVVTVGHGALKHGAKYREITQAPVTVADSAPGNH